MTEKSIYEVRTIYNVRIKMKDGIELSANLWMPIAKQDGEKFPAILEMIPYRKDDWRYISDHQRMTYFAERGYVGCRLDIRGTGSSEGIALDEYTETETRDGYDTVEWLAAQPWCNGNVGMWGISYGGFTAIQVAILQPPHLKAIVPMYATDDRYTDDVHYLGGCMVASEYAQYAVSQVGMNAMPPLPEYAGTNWAAQWKERLEQTPPWLIEWLRHQSDSPYWRNGSLAPDYSRIKCAIFNIGGWMDGYTNAALRMQAKCTAPTKTIIGNWVHSLPHGAYPGPNIDWLYEMIRFFDHWLKGIENAIMEEPSLIYFRREYTEPEPFPAQFNGEWAAVQSYALAHSSSQTLYLEDQMLSTDNTADGKDTFKHRPTHGTAAGLCYGAGIEPNGLARDLRPDEAVIPTYTSEPLAQPLDVLGFPEAILHMSCSAPVATVVVRLADIHPDGTSSLVSTGILNLTHRNGHDNPEPLISGEIYEIRIPFKATGYRFLTGHRIRLSIASAYWPVLWPTPYPGMNTIYRGGARPSRLELPLAHEEAGRVAVPSFKTTAPELISIGSGRDETPVWKIVEDVIEGSMSVKVYGGDTTFLPGKRSLFTSENLEMTAYHQDPANVRLWNEVVYRLSDRDYNIEIRATGTIRSTVSDFHVDVQLVVNLNEAPFFEKSWLESIPRLLL